jgi:BlaR1 peptidase M56
MSSAGIVALVAFAAYAIICGLLSIVVALWWRSSLHARSLTCDEWLSIRLTPAFAGATGVAAIVVPAFLRYEPAREMERPGFVLIALAMIGAAMIFDGARRAVRSYWLTRHLLARCACVATPSRAVGMTIDIVDSVVPIVAVIGYWRPRMVAASRVVDACTTEELACIVAHEQAHLAARDNLKRLLIAASPDALSWLPLGHHLAGRWRAASEQAADELAAGSAPRARLALASAIIKIAKLAIGTSAAPPTVSTLIDPDSIETRIQRLLEPPADVKQSSHRLVYALSLVALVLTASAGYPAIYRCTEALVGLGQ